MGPIVVVIDSGIRAELVGESLISHRSLRHQTLQDRSGHGTACAWVIKHICPSVKLISLGILDEHGMADAALLEQALRHCLSLDCHIINMSLSLLDADHQSIQQICDELVQQNKVVIASVRNRHVTSEPANFESVVGVRGALLSAPDEYWFNVSKSIQLVTDMTPVFTAPELGRYFVFSGNSKATAVATGLVAELFRLWPSLRMPQLLEQFSRHACRNDWKEQDLQLDLSLYKSPSVDCYLRGDAIKSIASAIARATGRLEENSLKPNDNLYEKGILSPEIIIPLLQELSKEFQCQISLRNVTPLSLQSVASIYDTLRGVDHKTV